MKGTVQFSELSQSGKSYVVTIDGEQYRYRTDTPPVDGQEVEFTYTTKEYKDKQYKWKDRLRPAGQSANPQNVTPAPGPTNPTTTTLVMHPDASRFVSNVVASLAATGTVKSHEDMKAWIAATYHGYMDAIKTYGKEPQMPKQAEKPNPVEADSFFDDTGTPF
jgi:hypothetical protein